MSVTLVHGGTTLTFRSGSFIPSAPSWEAQQIISESEDLTIRVANVSTNRRKIIRVQLKHLQETDEGIFHGYSSLLSVLDQTLDWSSSTCLITDADAEVFDCRYIGPVPFEVWESPKGVFSGEIIFRVEA